MSKTVYERYVRNFKIHILISGSKMKTDTTMQEYCTHHGYNGSKKYFYSQETLENV